MRAIEKVTISASAAGTFYSDTFLAPPSTHFVAVSAQRTAGSGTAVITIQTGWEPRSATDADWADLGLTITSNSGNLTLGTVNSVTPEVTRAYCGAYRIKAVVSSASASFDVWSQFTED